MDVITIFIQHGDASFIPLEIPLGVQLTLMEVLKGEGFPVQAICGGMALCATCAVDILNMDEILLQGANDSEIILLESLSCFPGSCRLSCQVQIDVGINGLKLAIINHN